MSHKSSASSSMTTCSNGTNPHVRLMKQQQMRQQHPKLTIHLHVKETPKKGKPDARVTKIDDIESYDNEMSDKLDPSALIKGTVNKINFLCLLNLFSD